MTDNTYDLSGASAPTLAPGESFVYYYGPVSALLGQHTNTATASGQYDSTTYNDTDNANYNGTPESIPSINVVKQISGNNAPGLTRICHPASQSSLAQTCTTDSISQTLATSHYQISL